MKFLGIVSSPRRRGNTALLVEEVLFGAKNRGAEVEIFYVGDLNINPWTEDDIEDDMKLIYRAVEGLRENDIIVFGAPVYHDHVSAQAKIVTDRFAFYEDEKSFPKGVKAVMVLTYEWDNPEGYDHVLDWLKQTFKRYYQVETVAALKAWNTTKKPVNQRPDLLRKAKDLGENLAENPS
ncbi:MAG: flavodoxin family protein [Candidatus Bathyarchaeia archaeon]